jgi:hypothetical protein
MQQRPCRSTGKTNIMENSLFAFTLAGLLAAFFAVAEPVSIPAVDFPSAVSSIQSVDGHSVEPKDSASDRNG